MHRADALGLSIACEILVSAVGDGDFLETLMGCLDIEILRRGKPILGDI